jgi:choline kinase
MQDPTSTNFLRRQVEILHALEVDDIVVVVGRFKELIFEDAERWELPVSFVVNPTPEMATSGSLHSFQFATRSQHGVLAGRKQTLLMDADIVYHRGVLQRLLDAPEQSALLVSKEHRGDEEEVLVYGSPDQPRFMGKGLSAALVVNEPCLGEAAGIVKFAPQDHALALATLDWMVGDPDAPVDHPRHRGFGPARRATEHEELTQRFMYYQKMRCVRFGRKLPFMECDDAAEYETVRQSFYPRLMRLEAETGIRP